MAKFVIHKKGFLYNDECFEDVGAIGTTVNVFDTLEEAKVEKLNQDIISMQNLKGYNAVDFFFSNHSEKFQQIEDYYKTEFGLTIADEHYFDFPGEINAKQAKDFLDIIGVSFHDIVEYSDENAPEPKANNNGEEEEIDYENELQEF